MPFSYYSYILSPDDQSCILPLVLPPTTLSTIFGCEAVTVGTAVTLNSGNQLTLIWRQHTAEKNPLIRPERHNLLPRSRNNIQSPLHIPHRKMRHVLHIQTPLRSQDCQPSPRLAIMSHDLGRLETVPIDVVVDVDA